MKKYTSILIFASVLSIGAMAQKQTPPEGSAPKDFKLSEKKTQSYSNGLKTTFVTYGSIPKVSVSLIIKTGNIHEEKNQTWLADLTGKMLKEGTSQWILNYSQRKLHQWVEALM
jgi:predicted Zn-dependent peptidase